MAILGRGTVQDTYNLLADGIAKLSCILAGLEGQHVEAWAGAHGLQRYFAPSIKGTAEVDWDDAASRQAFLSGIVADADRLLELARKARCACTNDSDEAKRIREAAELLMQLLAKDIERTEESPQIRQGVAKDRIASVHDPQMRHGRKSSKVRFDGHKGAVMVDAPSQLITAVGVAAGNAHDGDTALALVEEGEANTGLEVAETLGDCAYGDGETRRQFAGAERTIIAPVPRPPRTGKFPKTAFRIGRKLERVTCPGGCTTRKQSRIKLAANRKGKRYRVKRFVFPAARCAACRLRSRCLGGSGPRTITLHPRERAMQRARRYQGTEGFRQARRRRQVVEHRIARLRQLGVRQARYMGRLKTLFQLLLAATVANLTLIAAHSGAVRDALGALGRSVCRLIDHMAAHLGIQGHQGALWGPVAIGRRIQLEPVIPSDRRRLQRPAPQNPSFRPSF